MVVQKVGLGAVYLVQRTVVSTADEMEGMWVECSVEKMVAMRVLSLVTLTAALTAENSVVCLAGKLVPGMAPRKVAKTVGQRVAFLAVQ